MVANTVVVGSFGSLHQAIEAVRALRGAGFADAQIGLLSPDKDAQDASDPTHSRWEQGSAIGAAAGAVTGTGLGLAVLSGLIPPIGPAVAGGALVALLASAGGGAAAGTVLGALIGLGIPEDEAAQYEAEFHAGRALVTVDAGVGRALEAAEILNRHGAGAPVAAGKE